MFDSLPALVRPLVIGLSIAALLAALIEGVVLARLGRAYDWRAAIASLVIAIGRKLLDYLPIGLVLPGALWLNEHRLADIPMDRAWAWVALFFGIEFCYYWFHRANHRMRLFWATHAVHHSPNELNLSAAYRLGWSGPLTLSLVFFAPLAWVGFPPAAVLAGFSLNLLYQFWIHAAWLPRLGPLEGILNTPSAHRVHHAANREYLDANYGGVLIVFDRLFGTYVPERADIPCRYGLVDPLTTRNPFAILVHEWVRLARALACASGLRARLSLIFGPPAR